MNRERLIDGVSVYLYMSQLVDEGGGGSMGSSMVRLACRHSSHFTHNYLSQCKYF